MKDYILFGWRACGTSVLFQILSILTIGLADYFLLFKINQLWLYSLTLIGICLVITGYGLVCRPLYEVGLEGRFPHTKLGKKFFLVIFYLVALVLTIVYFMFFLIVASIIGNAVNELGSSSRLSTMLPTLYMGLVSITYFYLLLYMTATVEYVLRKKIYENEQKS